MAETAAVEIVADDVLRASALTKTVLAFAPPTTSPDGRIGCGCGPC
jgi:hypothetical protein